MISFDIKIHTLKKEDRGTYYCIADNGIGKAAQRAVAVDVEFPPVVKTTARSVSGGETVISQAFGYRFIFDKFNIMESRILKMLNVFYAF